MFGTCSALRLPGPAREQVELRTCLLTLASGTDMHRYSIPASDLARLSTHLLRELFERMVHLAGCSGRDQQEDYLSIHMPTMSRVGEGHQGGLEAYNAVGGISESESRSWQDGGREGGDAAELQAGSRCAACCCDT